MKEKFIGFIMICILVIAIYSLFYIGFHMGRVIGYHDGYDAGHADGWSACEKDATIDWGEWR